MRTMKDSGIPWIGEIPEGWKVCKTKDVFVRKNEKAHQANPIVLSLARAGVKVRDITKNEGQLAESYYDYNPVEPFDLLLNPMDLYSGANCSISLVRGVISPAYVNLKAKANACPRFYDYYYKTQYWSMAFFAHGKGISFDNRWTLGMDTLFRYNVPLPPLAEQQRIAEFLDRKCAEVDEMIALQEQIIEELKAYKQSVITEAVTKGLNPAAPMRDSGIDWIGLIPENWEVARLKFYASIDSGDAISNEQIDIDGEYPVFGGGEIMGYYSQYNTDEDKLIIGRVGARCGCVTMPKQKCWASDNALVLRSCLSLKYTYHLLQAINLNRLNTSNAQPLITATKVKNVFIPLTPPTEQQAIADYLDEKCADIDSLIQTKLSKIDSLKEYKKSIIYEYVTGKREVE